MGKTTDLPQKGYRMSLALVAKIEELSLRVERLEALLARIAQPEDNLTGLIARLEQLEAKRGPGRPPKVS